jgi:DNA-damage-inducible protein D
MTVSDHFPEVGKMIALAKGAQRKVADYKLTRYACYRVGRNDLLYCRPRDGGFLLLRL